MFRADNVAIVISRLSGNLGVSRIPELSGSVQVCTGIALTCVTPVRMFRLILTLNRISQVGLLTNKISTHTHTQIRSFLAVFIRGFEL